MKQLSQAGPRRCRREGLLCAWFKQPPSSRRQQCTVGLPPIWSRNQFICTVVRPALWICGGKHCSFHITSLPSDCEDWITCSRQFFTETEGNNIHISEFYPQSLREKKQCPNPCPQITTVYETHHSLFMRRVDFVSHNRRFSCLSNLSSYICIVCILKRAFEVQP